MARFRGVSELVVDLLEAVEIDRGAGEVVAVAVGARDLLLETGVEGAEVGQAGEAVGLAEGSVVLLLGGELQGPIDARHQLLLAERLGEVVGRAEREALALRLGVSLGGEEDDRRVGGPGVAAQAGERAESVHAGKEQVEQDQLGVQLGGALERRFAVAHRLDVVVRAEQFAQHHARIVVVLDHEDERSLALSRRGRHAHAGLGLLELFLCGAPVRSANPMRASAARSVSAVSPAPTIRTLKHPPVQPTH
jgi:hypothetical protein